MGCNRNHRCSARSVTGTYMRSRRIIAGVATIGAIALCAGLWPDERPAEAPPKTAKASTRYPKKPHLPRLPELPTVAEAPKPAPAVELPAGHPPAMSMVTLDTDASDEIGFVTVRVLEANGEVARRAHPFFDHCPILGPVGRTDAGMTYAVTPGECTLQARRRDGALFAWTDAVTVDVAIGDHLDVDLVLPSERTGGLGVGIAEDERGVAVTDVHADTPAGRAGLQPGDIITEVDGLPAATLTLEEFQQVMTGPEGTDITFVVEHPGDNGSDGTPYTIRRQYLSTTGDGDVIGEPPAVR